ACCHPDLDRAGTGRGDVQRLGWALERARPTRTVSARGPARIDIQPNRFCGKVGDGRIKELPRLARLRLRRGDELNAACIGSVTIDAFTRNTLDGPRVS